MKCKYIFLLFYIFTSLYMFYRIKHILNSVDPDTGMFFNSNLSMVFIFLAVIILGVYLFLSAFLRRCPLKHPKISLPISVASIVLFFSLLADTVVSIPTSRTGFEFLNSIVNISSFALCIFFVVYSLTFPLKFRINRYFYITPLAFWLIKLVSEYIKTAKMALISENGYKILACAFTSLFFLYFAKYQSRIISVYSHKVLMFFGFSAVGFCETFAMPQLAYYFKKGNVIVDGSIIVRNSPFELLYFALTGLFILVYIHAFFSNRNLSKRHHGSHTLNILSDEDVSDKTETQE